MSKKDHRERPLLTIPRRERGGYLPVSTGGSTGMPAVFFCRRRGWSPGWRGRRGRGRGELGVGEEIETLERERDKERQF